MRALRPHLKIDLVQEGLRIQIIDSQNRPMFKTGSAEVEPYMRDILRAIAPVLNGIPNRISLSGHTDDFPYATGEKGYSNWELSADRANASRRELVAGGLDDGKVLRVVGMAATMRVSDRGPDDAINRRISLLVLNQQAEQAILHENAESQNESLDDLKQPGPFLRLPFQHRHQPIRGDSVSMDISDFTRHSLMKPTNCWRIWSNICWIWCQKRQTPSSSMPSSALRTPLKAEPEHLDLPSCRKPPI